MRIAVWYNLHSGGAKRALHDQVKGLTERGHTVEVWSPPLEEKEYLSLSKYAKEHVVPLHFNPYDTARNIARFSAKNRYVFRRKAAFEEHCALCAEEIHAGNFDLLYTHSCFRLAVSPIAQFVKLPSVLYLQEPNRPLYEAIHGTSIWRADEPSTAPPPKRLWHGIRETMKVADSRVVVREEWKNAKAFDRILVNSYFSRESNWRAYALDSTVCYLGVDSKNFPYLNLPREDYVIGLGAFTFAKNQEFVIKALAQIPEPRPKLVWVGNISFDPAYVEGLKTLAESLGVNLEMKQMVTDEELIQLLNRASMMAYASRLEPFGYAPIEANACGTPVIAVAEGGMRETVVDGENGVLVDSNPAAMAAAIVKLRDNPTLARQLGETGRRMAETKWSVDAATERVEQNLLAVLNEKKLQRV